MNKKTLDRAYNMASMKPRYLGVQKLPGNTHTYVADDGSTFQHRSCGQIVSVLRQPSPTDYGLFEVRFYILTAPTVRQWVHEQIPGDELRFTIG